ncbi:permease [Microbacterium sp. NPDC055455]
MTTTLTVSEHPRQSATPRRGGPVVLVVAAGVAAVVLPELVGGASGRLLALSPRLHAALATFAGLVVQALPYVLVGAVASSTVAVVMTPARWARVLPKNKAAAVAVAALAGAFVPTCECSSVPLARRMIVSGVSPAPAMTFMVAAPSLNPLVVMATLAAFGGWEMAGARFVAGLLAVLGVGAIVAAFGARAFEHLVRADEEPVSEVTAPVGGWTQRWLDAMRHDAIAAATFLVVGGAIASLVSAFLPAESLARMTDYVLLAVLVMAALAIVASLCSLGDAFVAASMVGLHPAAMLSFIVVGPIIDLKLAAMMEGVLGHRAAQLVALAGLGSALVSTLIVAWLWGWL